MLYNVIKKIILQPAKTKENLGHGRAISLPMTILMPSQAIAVALR
ncbi:hypothetical protein SELR_pSRC200110 (plasmid) [Selenomonas ruminantium subsp. lactilytica TAM6421]|uniref:Uncharacterized protein n=1 Tax=Selenomonas ruminantium subsp. lactilytica (strain NBRC 103574 / TAM6421) TaxID=927704 RepID=I0GUV8_SELRL|nr:hypothetical protein SELR_pSRC200110 [Selenomonas ruminantium subsp. lactilytica TAM6421]